jgi:hypothetical protein
MNAIGFEVQLLNFSFPHTRKCASFLGLVLFLSAASYAAEKVTWKPLTEALLRIDDRAPKQWNIYHSGKKYDPLLLQLGTRALVIYIRDQSIYELSPAKLEHKGEDLLWRDTDKPAKPLATSDWSTRDIGFAWRVRVTLTEEGRVVDIQIPEDVNFRGFY